jgi:predicted nuclease of restriction endonuclease-like (RecB) superfamily
MSNNSSLFPGDESYFVFLSDLKNRIRHTQVKAALAVNQELVLLYWQIGKDILTRQQQEGWGVKIVERLAKDLKLEFPDIKGFSRTNLLYMRAFAEAYPDKQIVQQVVGQIPWGHNVRILDAVKDPTERLWYVRQTTAYGWSRAVLEMQIESGLYQRQGSAVTNFEKTLPKPQSDLAQQLLKDPYHFDFFTLGQEAQERDLERALVTHIRDFLLELGAGFSFVGSQYRLEVEGEEYFVDLLFYHLKLRCYVVIDLKMTEFRPEFSGKMNFYVSAVNLLLRHSDDHPTIGVILCRSKNRTIAELSLQGMTQPIAVSTHKLGIDIPAQLQSIMPTLEQLELEVEAAVAVIEAKSEAQAQPATGEARGKTGDTEAVN